MRKTIPPDIILPLFAALLLAPASPAAGKIIFVDADTACRNDGSSWQDAYRHLQDGFAAAQYGDEIHVAQGTYKPDQGDGIKPGDVTASFRLKNGVALKGGYAGFAEPDPNARDPAVYETILSGDLNGDDAPDFVNYDENSWHVLTGTGRDSTAVLDGFTVTGGNGFGGGITIGGSGNPTLRSCVFCRNKGAAIYFAGGSSTVTNCTFTNNSAGAAIYSWSGTPVLINCTFTGNSSGYGGAMLNVESNPILTNCTIANNHATTRGGGIYNSSGSAPQLTNCIIWGNSAPNGPQIALANGSSLTISYSDLQGGLQAIHRDRRLTVNCGPGNINADPMFVDAPNNNYHLHTTSPCVNAGDPTYIPKPPACDMDGEPRVINARIDMGADEFPQEGPVLHLSATNLEFYANPKGPSPQNQLLSISNTGLGSLNWHITEDCPWLDVYPKAGESTGQTNEVSLAVDISGLTPGSYNCNLTVTAPEALRSPHVVGVNSYVRDTLHVPSAYPTIQAAIDAASKGDTVIVAPGIYTGNGNRDIDFDGKAITVRSIDPNDPNIVASTVIDCQASNTDRHRGFHFHCGEDTDSILAGLTIINGYIRGDGAGICCHSSSPAISRCIITDCHAHDGGAIYCDGSDSSTITHCTLTGNSVSDKGGAIYLDNSNTTISHCMITCNWTDYRGGGVACEDSILTILHSTFAGNSAESGGAIVCYAGDCFISHSILWADSATSDAPELALWTTGSSGSSHTSHATITYSDIQGGLSNIYRSQSSTILWDVGNIHADPHFVDPAAGDYHLSAISPCINASDPAYGPAPYETDIDGEPRVMAARVDIGADEFASTLTPFIALSPTELDFYSDQDGTNPPPQTLFIRNTGKGTLNWQITSDCPWLDVHPTTGLSDADINQTTINVDISGLAHSLYKGNLIITSSDADNSPRTIPVCLTVFLGGRFFVPSEFQTIQEAIDWAEDGDTIIVAPGTYTGPGNRDIDFHGKAVTVRGIDPNDSKVVAATIIDCQGTADDPHHGFYFHSGEDSNSVLAGLTITNGYAYYGGAIECTDNSSPTIAKCLMARNYADRGGAIYCGQSSSTIAQCVIANNSAWAGGAIRCRDGSHTSIINCTVVDNSAEYRGGGINCYGANDILISNCILWGNTCSYGPQLALSSASDLIVTVSYSDVQQGELGVPSEWGYTLNWGPGNIDAEPFFINPTSGDYHLSADSSCIDAGDPNYVSAQGETDIDGDPRVFNGRIDIGADELSYEGPLIAVSPRQFEFFAYEGGADPNAQMLSIRNRGFDTLNWQITEDCPWLEVTPIDGISSGEPNQATLAVDISGLLGNYYDCELTISDSAAENSPRTVPVSLHVLGPVIDLSASRVEFVAEEGGSNPQDQVVTIYNSGGGSLNWIITHDFDWLQVTPAPRASRGPGTKITLSVDISGLQRGVHTCQLTILDPNSVNSPQTVDVALYIAAELVRVPSHFPTIQQAIDFVFDGGTVLVADGIYSGPGNRNIDFHGKAITVRSENGPDNCIIDCNWVAGDYTSYLAFHFYSGEGGDSILSGFTITDARGSAIQCLWGSSPTITNCHITANRGSSGGGITCQQNSNPFIVNCHISDNAAYTGGAIACSKSSPIISHCIINHNVAHSIPHMIVKPGTGGGIFCSESNPRIEYCRISNNRADLGGGIYCFESSPAITNCLITGNIDPHSWAYTDGGQATGAIYCYASSPTISNCTMSGNVNKAGVGTAICSYKDSNPTITNCIFSNNEAGRGNELSVLMFEYYWGEKIPSSATVLYSDVRGGPAAAHIDTACTLNWDLGNIDADPLFVESGYWDANGTPDNTRDDFWVDGDYHLKSEGWRWDTRRNAWSWDDVTSPCIDAGNPGTPLGEELLFAPADPNNEWGQNLRINMGAYGGTAEASMAAHDWALLADLTNDGTVDWQDFVHTASNWLAAAEGQAGDLNRDGTADLTDLALLADDWLKQTAWHD